VNRNRAARILVILGCLITWALAALHGLGGYPRVSVALSASNLASPLKAAMLTAFLLPVADWIAITVIALVAMTESRVRKPIVLLCGIALLVDAAIAVRLTGWFIGDDMLLAAGILIFCGALLFQSAPAQ
jgi:hypothetical protein